MGEWIVRRGGVVVGGLAGKKWRGVECGEEGERERKKKKWVSKKKEVGYGGRGGFVVDSWKKKEGGGKR